MHAFGLSIVDSYLILSVGVCVPLGMFIGSSLLLVTPLCDKLVKFRDFRQLTVMQVEGSGASFIDVLFLSRVPKTTQGITGSGVLMCALVCKFYDLSLSPLNRLSVIQRWGQVPCQCCYWILISSLKDCLIIKSPTRHHSWIRLPPFRSSQPGIHFITGNLEWFSGYSQGMNKYVPWSRECFPCLLSA